MWRCSTSAPRHRFSAFRRSARAARRQGIRGVLGGLMPFEFFDHTGDIGVRVSGATIEDLFADAAMALTATLIDAATVQPRERAWIVLEAPSLDLLLVDWLNEIVFRFDVDEMLVARTSPRVIQEGDTWKLEGPSRVKRSRPHAITSSVDIYIPKR